MKSHQAGDYGVNLRQWPFAYFSLKGTLSDEQYGNYLKELVALPNRQEKFGLILDGTSLDTLSAKQRLMSAEELKKHREALAAYCVGMVFLVRNKLLQGALTAIFWVQPPPVETLVRVELQVAVAWLTPALLSAGARLPIIHDPASIAAALTRSRERAADKQSPLHHH